MGGLITKLLSFVRVDAEGVKTSDAQVETGGGEIITAKAAQGSGVDAHPLPGDYPVALSVPRSGGLVVVAYAETDATPQAQPGDHRTYSRNAETREEAAQVWLKADGSVVVEGPVGSTVISPNGTVVTSNNNGSITLQNDGTSIMATGDTSMVVNSNGQVLGKNSSGEFKLEPGGDFVANGAKMKTDGDVVTSDGKSLRNHVHAYTWTDGPGSGSTNPPS